MSYDVDRPIQNSPFDEHARHWYIQRGRDPKLVERRRESFVFRPKTDRIAWDLSDGTLRLYEHDAERNDYENAYELALVNDSLSRGCVAERMHRARSRCRAGALRNPSTPQPFRRCFGPDWPRYSTTTVPLIPGWIRQL